MSNYENVSSIYQKILNNMDSDGVLKMDFNLDDLREGNMKFAFGAWDGMYIYHSSNDNRTDASVIWSMLLNAIKGVGYADSEISKYLADVGVIKIMDDLTRRILCDIEKINVKKMFEVVKRWATESNNIELTKLGLACLGLFDIENDEECREIIINLGKCEEFTLYSIVAMGSWKDVNDLMFEYAKTLSGWGKIHVVERLKVTNETIRKWMLTSGCKNSVVNAYSAYTCAIKGRMMEELMKDLDEQLLDGVGVIIEALHDEGPAPGISVYQNVVAAIHKYLEHLKNRCNSIERIEILLLIQEHYKDDEEIVKLCDDVLNNNDCVKTVSDVLNSDDDINLHAVLNAAKVFDLDTKDGILRRIQREPIKYSYYVKTIIDNKDIQDKIIELYENAIPFEKLDFKMGMSTGLGEHFQHYMALSAIVSACANYPHLGTHLVEMALWSSVQNNRFIAYQTLEKWIEISGRPLKGISKELHRQLTKLSEQEVNEELKKKIKTILNK